MKLGADDFITKSTSPEYFIITIKNRIERYKKLKALIIKDNLTGFYEYSFTQNQLEIKLKESIELHNPLSIAIIDLDKFKSINDAYGHQAGDHVLKSLGILIRKKLRTNDIIGLYSREKFIIILPNTATEAAKTMVDELRKQFLAVNYYWNDQMFNASFSAGIASFPDFHTSQELIEAANTSLLKSKKLGKNRVETIV
jgi:diguanylate cyclase (GGDEF)-like protein